MTEPIAVILGAALLLALWRGPLWRGRPLPGVTRTPPLLLGHRGVRGTLPENTLAAFRHALERGLDGLETDVQRTRDGVLVLVHDEVVGGLRVTDATAAEVARVVEGLTRLDELLELVKAYPGILLNVEIKTTRLFDGGLAVATARALLASGLEERVIVSSFNAAALARLRLAAPRLLTAYLWSDGPEVPRLLRTPWPAGWLHVDALHPHHRFVDADLVARAEARRLGLNVWTVNDPIEIRRLHALGVGGIMGDDPDVLLEALRGGPS